MAQYHYGNQGYPYNPQMMPPHGMAPTVIYSQSGVKPPSKIYERYAACQSLAMGIIQLLCGLIMVACNISLVAYVISHTGGRYDVIQYGIHGFWGGLLVCVHIY